MNDTPETARAGLITGLGTYLLWGLMPFYIRLMQGLPALEVLTQRVLWSCVLVAIIATVIGGWPAIWAALVTPRVRNLLIASAFAISINWLLYTWSVLNGHVLETSLGYFINPLVNVLFGVLFLRERLTRPQMVAVALAVIGVAITAIAHGALPWISLTLAFSFGLYGLLRKQAPVTPVTGLFVETALLIPLALGWLELYADGLFAREGTTLLLLMGGGVVTGVPLLMFGFAAQRVRLSTLGFMQYITPSMIFLQAVFLFGEPLDRWQLAAFVCIWTGLAIYAVASARALSLSRNETVS